MEKVEFFKQVQQYEAEEVALLSRCIRAIADSLIAQMTFVFLGDESRVQIPPFQLSNYKKQGVKLILVIKTNIVKCNKNKNKN